MTLTYDFDIFQVIPGSGSPDPQLDGFLTDIGFKPGPESETVALFRDPRTADALRNAAPVLRDFFLASGFGLNTYSSGAPPGRYPAQDEDARLEIIRRMTENAETQALPRPEDYPEGGDVFRLGAFLAELTRSEPMDMTGSHALGPTAHVAEDSVKIPFAHGMPQVFDTEPLAGEPVAPAAEPVRRKFWQNRFFRVAVAAGLVAGAVQLVSGQPLLVLASL